MAHPKHYLSPEVLKKNRGGKWENKKNKNLANRNHVIPPLPAPYLNKSQGGKGKPPKTPIPMFQKQLTPPPPPPPPKKKGWKTRSMSSDKINFASRKNLPLVDIVSLREINRGESQRFLLLVPSLSLLFFCSAVFLRGAPTKWAPSNKNFLSLETDLEDSNMTSSHFLQNGNKFACCSPNSRVSRVELVCTREEA